MTIPLQLRQIAQYPLQDAAIPGTLLLMQMGDVGSPYASILASDLVTSALAAGGDLNLSAANGSLNFLFDQGAGAVTLNVAQGELLVTPALRTSTLNATFVNASGVLINGDPVVTASQLVADRAASVTSFNRRTGDIMLMADDILRAGGAPIRDAHFAGWITAPSVWDTRANDDTVATTNWVHRAIHDTGVSSFNGRTGCVTFTVADFNAATAAGPGYPTAPSPVLGDASSRIATTLFVDESLQDLHLTISDEQLALLTSTYAPLNSPQFTGIPTAPTANPGTSTGQLATTSFVMHAITASTSGVASFNTRTGAVVLQATDISGAGGALLNSPAFVGGPTAPTPAPGTSNTVLATTAFVQAAITAGGGVTSFNTRTGAVTLSLADVTGTGVLASTPLTGVPTAPTAAPGTSSTQIATTAFVAASAAAGVTSFMSRTGAVTLTSADVSAAGGALNASPAFTGTPTAPTPATADNSTTLATTAFVKAALAATGVTSFNGRSGVVTLTAADVTGVGGALLASPTFTGVPAAPTAAPATNTTQLATTAFVQAALSASAIAGWTLSLNGSQSVIAATGTVGSIFKVTASLAGGNNSLNIQNQAAKSIVFLADNTSNSGLASVNYLTLQNNVSGSPAIITVGGSDANRSIQLTPVGSGTVQATGNLVVNATGPMLQLNKPVSGTPCQVGSYTSGLLRWMLNLGNGNSESGGNAGSDLTLDRYSDAGGNLGTVVTILRATGEIDLSPGSTAINGVSLNMAFPTLRLNAAASGQGSYFTGRVNGLARWEISHGNATAESGSNAGSDWTLSRSSDAGALIDYPIFVQRSTGYVGVGTNANLYGPAQISVACAASIYGITTRAQASAVTSYPISFQNHAGTVVGQISSTDTATAYATTSDARLKTDDSPFEHGREVLDLISVRSFTWGATGARDVGVMAQELDRILPTAVAVGRGAPGDADYVPWGTDYSKLVPFLIQALQKALRRIDALEAAV